VKINAEWHKAHRMPKNPTLEERIKWHIAHAIYCACRPMPAKIREAIEKRKKK
jgi:hypothetical protein